MGKIVFSRPSLVKRGAIRRFHANYDVTIAERALNAIKSALAKLILNPEIGRPFESSFLRRELVIPSGNNGFIALYAIEKVTGWIIVVALRHQKEKDYATPLGQ